MVAIHSRFRAPMLDRLGGRLVNVQGETAVLCSDSQLQASLVGVVDQLDQVGAVVNLDGLDERRWDSLICGAELWQLPSLVALAASLANGGRLFFVEPVSAFGLARRVQSVGRSAIRSRFGLDFECDVPQALREVGLTPTSTDRFRVGGPIFTFAAGEARRY